MNISNSQLKRYYRYRDINYYFTGKDDGNEVTEGSIFKQSYNKLYLQVPKVIQGRDYDAHILLLGHSIQPIILSILTLRAPKIVLFYSKDSRENYGGVTHWTNAAKKIIDNSLDFEFVGSERQGDDDSPYLVKSADTADIYHKIHHYLKTSGIPKERVALDITGGKKTMVSGAFMAATQLDIDTYYVDAADFYKDLPVPGTEMLIKLPNPLKVEQYNNGDITRKELGEENVPFLAANLKGGR